MSDQTSEKVETPTAATEVTKTAAPEVGKDADNGVKQAELKGDAEEKPKDDALKDELNSDEKPDEPSTAAADSNVEAEKPVEQADTEMKDAAEEAPADSAATEIAAAKNNSRRKSTGGDSKSKTLAKKGSKAKISHRDAKPGDHFLVKLKGYPAWPAIVCDEEMLPQALLSTRPVTAARADGTYNDNYADGGKRVNDRTFPVMYLHTNEFGWVHNGAFTELTTEKAQASIKEKMRNDLREAFSLAADSLPLDEYKSMLAEKQEEAIKDEQARADKKAKAAATPKKSKKVDEDEDVEMADATQSSKSKSKKRKAEDDASTPQRSDSVKKPKIKLNVTSTPKAANGTNAKKEESASKPAKAPKKKGADKKKEGEPKEAKMTAEQRHNKKEREVMFLRHKLQRGLLTRDQQPQPEEMPQMSEWLGMLEKMPDLEVAIIRATKINKVLKAMLKLDKIPREEEFKLHSRASDLLDLWNQSINKDGPEPNGKSKGDTSELHVEAAEDTEQKAEETPAEEKKTAAESELEKKADAAEPEKKTDGEEEKEAAPQTENAAPEAIEAAA